MSRWWLHAAWELIRDIAVTGTGLIIIWRQVLYSSLHPSGLLLGTGLALTVPSVAAHVRALLPGGEVGHGEASSESAPPNGGHGPSSPPSRLRRRQHSSSSAGG